MIDLKNRHLRELEQIKNLHKVRSPFPKKYISKRKFVGPIITFLISRFLYLRLVKEIEKSIWERQLRFEEKSCEVHREVIRELNAVKRLLIDKAKVVGDSFFEKDYFVGGLKSNYDDYSNVKPLTEELGSLLIKGFNPKRPLDVGCAYGFLPIYFRKRKLEAYGIDISQYAISKGAKKYLFVRDACDLGIFEDGFFDLVVSIELLEHLSPRQAEKALKEMKRVSNHWIVLSIAVNPMDMFEDLSHINIRSRNEWNKLFSRLNIKKNEGKEEWLSSQQWSKKIGWTDKFFVLEV